MKLAFVNQRYGLEVNGGSEYYTRMLAEHLAKMDGMEIEILTTTAVDHNTWKNQYTKEIDSLNGITIRRFPVKHPKNSFRFRIADKMRRMNIKPKSLVEKNWMIEQGPYTPKLIRYIREHKNDYDIFIFVTYLYYPTVFGLPEVADKAILIPTAHDEPYLYMDIMKKIFTKVKGICYLTVEEKELVQKNFHNQSIPSEVIGTGISYTKDDITDKEKEEFRMRHNIKEEYLIYAGRIDEAKGCGQMFSYFLKKKEEKSGVKLVLIGQAGMEIPQDESIEYLGFVEEHEKQIAIAGAKALILPSANESLSIAVLEAMAMGVPVLVNGKCPVLKGHVERSLGGYCYCNYKDFQVAVDNLWNDSYITLSKNAEEYVINNYSWSGVIKKFLAMTFIVN